MLYQSESVGIWHPDKIARRGRTRIHRAASSKTECFGESAYTQVRLAQITPATRHRA
jgi:hypothetical protein